jgi:hypothetical protein
MKLKSLAALIIRVVGALFILGGIQSLGGIVDTHSIISAIIEVVTSFIIGYCLIYFSKKLAALFCKGLDDDDVA